MSGIKGELKEANGWLEAIKHNTDVANDLQKEANEDIDNIAENMRRSVDNQGKLQKTSEEGNKLLGDIKNAIDGLDDINVNISQEGGAGFEATISASTDGVESLGTTGDVTGEGYTTDDTPSNIALPAEQTINDSFGTFTLSEEPSYRDQLASSLSSLSPQVSNPQCATSLDIPWFDISSFSITSKNISMDFCPYESYLSWLGQFLVLCVSLRQLYLLAA